MTQQARWRWYAQVGTVLALTSAQALAAGTPLPLPQRQQLFRVLMQGEIDISKRVDDPLILQALRREPVITERGGASLNCRVMDRIEALNEKQRPLREQLYRKVAAQYKVSRKVIEAVLQEGQSKGWNY